MIAAALPGVVPVARRVRAEYGHAVNRVWLDSSVRVPVIVDVKAVVRSLVVVISALCLTALTACGARTASNRIPGNQSPASNINLNISTVDDLLASIANAGLAAPNPRDVTQRDCPAIGCIVKVETDTVSIMRFPTSGRAQLYAGSTHHVFLIEDVVIGFSPAVSMNEKLAYEAAVERVME